MRPGSLDPTSTSRTRLSGELGRYSLALDALGVTDEELVPQATPTSLFKRAVWLAIGVLLLAPFAIAGFLINAVPALLVVVAGLTVKSPGDEGNGAHPRRDSSCSL